jgi:hypothetical protein
MSGTRGAVWLAVVLVAVMSASVVIAQEGGWSQGSEERKPTGSLVRVLESYWIDIAAHLVGARESVWRTDLVVLNRSGSEASVVLLLHLPDRSLRLDTTVPARSQRAFDDVVGMLGHEGKGSLEVRSDQSLTVHGRTYSVSESGTVGQFVDGRSSGDGLRAGESGWLAGLRQFEGEYRSNICITNTGTEVAEVRVRLFTAGGFELISFPVVIGPREAHHEIQPYRYRRTRNDISCGCALIEVARGTGILVSASVIDQRTNDAITVPMKR